MPFIQNMRIPEQIKQSVTIDNYDGGLNNVTSSFELSLNESNDLLNVIQFDSGSIETRPGIFKYITNLIPEVIQKIYVYEVSGVEQLILASSTNLYKATISASPTIDVICTTFLTASCVQIEDKLYIVDGAKYRVYDNTNVYEIINPITLVGTAQAGDGTTITLPNAANATDDYYNGCTIYISSGTGSGQSRVISDYVGATKVATVPNWNIAPDNTSMIYLTQGAQGEVTTNETTKNRFYCPSYLEFSDTHKGANNISMVSMCRCATLHRTRLWFGTPTTSAYANIVYPTDVDNMYYVPANGYTPAITNDSDTIHSLFSFNDVLLINKNRTIFALYGFDYTDFDLKEVTVHTGPINGDVIAKIGNYVYYLGSDSNVYALYDVRTDYKKLLTKNISEKIDILRPPISIMHNDWKNSRAVHHNGYYLLAIKDKILVFHQSKGWLLWDTISPTAWIEYNNTLILTNAKKYLYRLALERFHVQETITIVPGQTDYSVSRGYLNDINKDMFVTIISGGGTIETPVTNAVKLSHTQFRLPQMPSGTHIVINYTSNLCYNDDGVPYHSYWTSKDLDCKRPDFVKQLRKIWLTADIYKYFTSKITIKTYVDYDSVDSGFTLKNQISLWGTAMFGDRFINRNIVEPIPIEVNRRGRIIKFKVENYDPSVDTPVIDTPFRCFKINGEVTLKK